MNDILKPELLDELIKGKTPDEISGPDGILRQLTAAVVERALQEEMSVHLGRDKHARSSGGSKNSRNGTTPKKVKTQVGDVEINVPLDREGTFEPQLVKKRQRRLEGFDKLIIELYARGMTTREIQGHFKEIYGADVSPDLVSRVTEGVMDEVRTWQARPLDSIYPIVFLDAMVVKVRDQGVVGNKSAYLAIGVNIEGKKELLGIWLETKEGAKFWLKIMNELRNRGVQDILLACVDGLKGFPEAIEAVFSGTVVQTCIVHMLRNSVRFVRWGERRQITAALAPIYKADSVEAAEVALQAFREEWDSKYPMIGRSWADNWDRVIPFLNFPPEIRKAIYTTNAIEAANRQARKALKTRGHFPTDDAVLKLLYLALMRAEKKWTMPIRDWGRALHQFGILFEGRLPL